MEESPIIILAEGWRLVDNARAAIVRDVRVCADPEGSSLLHVAKIREERLVGLPLEFRALELRHHLKALMGQGM